MAAVTCRRITTGREEKVASLIQYIMELDGLMRNMTTIMWVQFERRTNLNKVLQKRVDAFEQWSGVLLKDYKDLGLPKWEKMMYRNW